jgi:catechol 2,3-dioxygenase
MSAPKVQTYEHAEVRVKDLGSALEFYTDVIGLHEIAREDGVVYLGCGYDENYDLAITEGGTGVVHFALRAEDEDALERYTRRVEEAGIATERRDGSEPGQEQGVRFEIPGGHRMELVLVADNRYLETYRPVRPIRGIAPLDGDHINVMSTDVKGLSEFLRDVLDFKWSDVIVFENGHWAASWVRMSGGHHDLGIFGTDDPGVTLHHVAWTFSSVDHMKFAADLLAAAGIRLELGMSRHPVGANLYAYFWEPGGNRFELTAEGAILDARTPPRFWKSFHDTLDAWGDPVVPETFPKGS